MEMNDILNGLNSCDDNCCDAEANNNCCCGNNIGGNPGFNPGCGCGQGNCGLGTGCGLGSWIWILLILFYCGGCGSFGNNGARNNSCCCDPCCCDPCCCECQKTDCCCCNNTRNTGGLLGNCSAYLFLLVILFLCNGWGGCRNGAGLGNLANNCGC